MGVAVGVCVEAGGVWVCVHGPLQWTRVLSRTYSSFMPSVPAPDHHEPDEDKALTE